MALGILEIISLALKFAMALWSSSKKTPEEIKLDAIAQITKDLNHDLQAVDKALVENDAVALSDHFEQLRLRALKATDGEK